MTDGFPAHSGNRTVLKFFRLKVWSPNISRMLVTFAAENRRAAIKYAQTRWPEAEIEILEP